jgi:hypothetical protein
MMESADLGQREDAALLGWLNGASSGESFLSARWVRETW